MVEATQQGVIIEDDNFISDPPNKWKILDNAVKRTLDLRFRQGLVEQSARVKYMSSAPDYTEDIKLAQIDEDKALESLRDEWKGISRNIFGEKYEHLDQYVTSTPSGNIVANEEELTKIASEYNKRNGGGRHSVAHFRQFLLSEATNAIMLREVNELMEQKGLSVPSSETVLRRLVDLKVKAESEIEAMAAREKSKQSKIIEKINQGYQSKFTEIKESYEVDYLLRRQNLIAAYQVEMQHSIMQKEQELSNLLNEGHINKAQHDKLLSEFKDNAELEYRQFERKGAHYAIMEEYNKTGFIEELQQKVDELTAQVQQKYAEVNTLIRNSINNQISRISKKYENNRAALITQYELGAKNYEREYLKAIEEVKKRREGLDVVYRNLLEYRSMFDKGALAKLFGDAFLQSTGHVMKSIGTFIESIGMGGMATDFMIGKGGKFSAENYIYKPELSWQNFYKESFWAQSLGNLLPTALPTIGVSLLTGSPVVGALAGASYNASIMAGDTINQSLANGDRLSDAFAKGRKEFIQNAAISLPADYIFSKAITGAFGSQRSAFKSAAYGWSVRGGIVQGLEVGVSEMGTEMLENALQAVNIDESKSFIQELFDSSNVMQGIEAGIGSMMLAGTARMGMLLQKHNVLNPVAQNIIGSILKYNGDTNIKALLQYELSEGLITQDEYSVIVKKIDDITTRIAEAQGVGLDGSNLQLFVTLSQTAADIREQANNITDALLKKSLLEKAAQYEKQASSILNGDIQAGQIDTGAIPLVAEKTDADNFNKEVNSLPPAKNETSSIDDLTDDDIALLEVLRSSVSGLDNRIANLIKDKLKNPDNFKEIVDVIRLAYSEGRISELAELGQGLLDFLDGKPQEQPKGSLESTENTQSSREVIVAPERGIVPAGQRESLVGEGQVEVNENTESVAEENTESAESPIASSQQDTQDAQTATTSTTGEAIISGQDDSVEGSGEPAVESQSIPSEVTDESNAMDVEEQGLSEDSQQDQESSEPSIREIVDKAKENKQKRKEFLDRFHKTDIVVFQNTPARSKKKKLDAIRDRVVKAKMEGIITEEDFDLLMADINKLYTQIPVFSPEVSVAPNPFKDVLEKDINAFETIEPENVDKPEGLDKGVFGRLKKVFEKVFGEDVIVHTDSKRFKKETGREYKNKDGVVWGGTYVNKEGKRVIFINPENLSSEVLLHEFYHPFDDMMADAARKGDKQAAAAIKRLNQLAEEGGWLQKVKDNPAYKNSSEEIQQSEARVMMIGEVGNKNLNKTFYNKLKKAVTDAIEWLANKLGVSLKGFTPEQILNLKLDDIVRASLASAREGEFAGQASNELRLMASPDKTVYLTPTQYNSLMAYLSNQWDKKGLTDVKDTIDLAVDYIKNILSKSNQRDDATIREAVYNLYEKLGFIPKNEKAIGEAPKGRIELRKSATASSFKSTSFNKFTAANIKRFIAEVRAHFKAEKVILDSKKIQSLLSLIEKHSNAKMDVSTAMKAIIDKVNWFVLENQNKEALMRAAKAIKELKAAIKKDIKKVKKARSSSSSYMQESVRSFLKSLDFPTPHKVLKALGELELAEYGEMVQALLDAYTGKQGARELSREMIQNYFDSLQLGVNIYDQQQMQARVDSLIDKGILPVGSTVDDYLKYLEDNKLTEEEKQERKDERIEIYKQEIQFLQEELLDAIDNDRISEENKKEAQELAELDVNQIQEKRLPELNDLLNNLILDDDITGVGRFLAYNKYFKEKQRQLEQSGLLVRKLSEKRKKWQTWGNFLNSIFFSPDDTNKFTSIVYTPLKIAINKAQSKVLGLGKRKGVIEELNDIIDRNNLTIEDMHVVGVYQMFAQARDADHLFDMAMKLIDDNVKKMFAESLVKGDNIRSRSFRERAIGAARALEQLGVIKNVKITDTSITFDYADSLPDLNELTNNLKEGQLEVYNYIREKFEEIKPAVRYAAKSYYGKEWVEHENYAPMVTKRFHPKVGSQEDGITEFESMASMNSKVSTKPSDRLKKRGELANSDFYYETNAYDTFAQSYYETSLTAAAGREIKTLGYLVNSTAFGEFINGYMNEHFGGEPTKYRDNHKIFRDKIIYTINEEFKVPFFEKKNQPWLTMASNVIINNVIRTLLSTLDQGFKQFIPNYLNTLFVTDIATTAVATRIVAQLHFDAEKADAFYSMFSGQFRSAKGMEAYDKQVNFFKNGKLLHKFDKATEMATLTFIGKNALTISDREVNNITLVAAYIQELIKQGKIKNANEFSVDDAIRNPNILAITNAENRASQVNNASKRAERPEGVNEKKDIWSYLFTLKTHSLSAFNEFANSLRVAFSLNTPDGARKQALAVAGGYMAQIISFNILRSSLKFVYAAAGVTLAEAIFGVKVRDKSDEEKEKQKEKEIAKFIAWTLSDMFLGGSNVLVESAVQKLFDFVYAEAKKSIDGKKPNYKLFPFAEDASSGGIEMMENIGTSVFHAISIHDTKQDSRELAEVKNYKDINEVMRFISFVLRNGDMYKLSNSIDRTLDTRIKEMQKRGKKSPLERSLDFSNTFEKNPF